MSRGKTHRPMCLKPSRPTTTDNGGIRRLTICHLVTLKREWPFNEDRCPSKGCKITRSLVRDRPDGSSFERGLSDVTATYHRREDGDIQVLNRGYDERTGVWKEAEGRAAFIGDPTTVGSLKVSFFGPFYGGYHLIALDRDQYAWAMISDSSRDYLWILARTQPLPPEVRERLVEQAKAMGFATDGLLWVKHHREEA